MEKVNFPRKFKIYLPLIILFILLFLIMPKNVKFNYDYKKGTPWMYETLIAQFDFPILKTDMQIQEELDELWSQVIPYYSYDATAEAKAASILSSMDFGENLSAKSIISSAISDIYSKGIMSESSGVTAEFSDMENAMVYVQRGRKPVKVPVSEIFQPQEAVSYLSDIIEKSCPEFRLDTLDKGTALKALISPNLFFDQKSTDYIHKESLDNISHTSGVVRAGQVLVSNGELITVEIEQLLDSYKAEYDSSVGYDGPVVLLWLSHFLLAFSIVLVLFLAIYYCNSKIFSEYNTYLYLLMVFSLAMVASSLIARTDPSLFYLTPFTLVAMYLLAFFKQRMVFIVYFISLLPMLIFAPNGMELFMIYLVAGSVGMLVFGFFNRGWLQFVTAFIVFAVMALVWLAFRLADTSDGLNDYYNLIKMALGAFLSVAGYPLIFLFEKLFRLLSSSKLVELSDTSNKLLRMLADKAPGTFQHSLQVMNISDAVARSIDANIPLVRAAALYHDIGKISNPQCFTENENHGVNYHSELTPKESAQEIIRHVSDGLALADKYGLPQELKDFILTHHGTTCAAYFYTKYLNEGGDPEDIADFYYDGVKPTTREQVILMICDAVEAASRSLKDYSSENISALVDKIIDGKDEDGQFSDSDISLRELNVVRGVIKSYLQQMYHSRVVYPKRLNRTKK